MDLATEGEAAVCVSLCQAVETLVGLGSLMVVVEVVAMEPVHIEPRIVGTHSTCAVSHG